MLSNCRYCGSESIIKHGFINGKGEGMNAKNVASIN